MPGHYGLGYAGDTFNTAWYVRQLQPGWQVDYVTAVGRDAISDQMLAFFRSEGIGTEGIQRVDGRTVGLYLIALSGGERRFAYWRGQSAARQLAADHNGLPAAVGRPDILYFSGITLAVLEGAGRQNLCRVISEARQSGSLVVFDPNLRPALWPDRATMCDAIMEPRPSLM